MTQSIYLEAGEIFVDGVACLGDVVVDSLTQMAYSYILPGMRIAASTRSWDKSGGVRSNKSTVKHLENATPNFDKLIKAYVLTFKCNAGPLASYFLFKCLLNDPLWLGSLSGFCLVVVEFAVLKWTLSRFSEPDPSVATTHDESASQVNQFIMNKIVSPISDATRMYITSIVYYYMIYSWLLRSKSFMIRLAGFTLALSYWCAMEKWSFSQTFEQRIDKYHKKWIWLFGASFIPATAIASTKSMLMLLLLAPLLLFSTLINDAQHIVVKQNDQENTDASKTCVRREMASSFDGKGVLTRFLQEALIKFGWASWAVDSTNWLLMRFVV